MSMTLKETPGCLTVPELKDLVGYLRGGASSARKDDLIERILVAMLGSELETAWTLLDETQQAAVAEAAHHPLGEYSDRRFRGLSGRRGEIVRLFGRQEDCLVPVHPVRAG
jgi:hypothetical protein